jgi:2-desacetyl-2-hydroxyethyl bacteriochlorophyllide A dehydrogenase
MEQRLIFSAPQTVGYMPMDVPERPGPEQLRIRTLVSAISHGTEMVSFFGTSPFATRKITADRMFVPREPADAPFFPVTWLGYDLVGQVTAVGEKVTRYQVGDRVFLELPHQTGYLLDEKAGGTRLKPETPAEDALMLSLATVAFVAAQDAEVRLGDRVAVFGGGTVGQLTAQMAFLNGASRVFLAEPRAERRALAASLCPVEGIDPTAELPALAIRKALGGAWPDVVLECSGKVKALSAAVQAAGIGGTVVAVGFYAGDARDFSFAEEFLHNRVTIKASMGVWGCPSRFPLAWDRRRNLDTVLDLIEKGRLNFKGFRTLKVPFAEAQRAYNTIRDDPTYLRIFLTY